MVNQTQNRFGTEVFVSFPEFPTIELSVRSFKLVQEAGKHDRAELQFNSFSPIYYKMLSTGVLIKVIWRTQHASGEFIGHVYSSKLKTQATITKNAIIKAMGASFPLKESNSKIWINRTPSDVVTEIGKLTGIKTVVTPYNLTYQQISMAGHTYWEKIQELAFQHGYVAQMIGAELHFHPIDVMLAKWGTSIPILSHQGGEIPFGIIHESQTLDFFEANVDDLGEHGGNSRRDKLVEGFDPFTGRPYSSTSSPNTVGKNLRKSTKDSFFKEHMPQVMSVSADAAKKLAEAQAQNSRWSISAEGAGQGDPRISPYRTIQINGTYDHTDGFWVVKRVEHTVLFDGRYTVDFTCVVDGLYNNLAAPFRPAVAALIPSRNEELELSTGLKTGVSASKTVSTKPIIKSNKPIVEPTPSRWKSV